MVKNEIIKVNGWEMDDKKVFILISGKTTSPMERRSIAKL